ncbi:MAG: hypothetical protein IKS35_03900, partial [Clostridia bacterium]|nr:hypothetical protein [Clostridia bacterium]
EERFPPLKFIFNFELHFNVVSATIGIGTSPCGYCFFGQLHYTTRRPFFVGNRGKKFHSLGESQKYRNPFISLNFSAIHTGAVNNTSIANFQAVRLFKTLFLCFFMPF